MKYRKICFYSGFGNGDIFNTREFIKEVSERGDAEYFFAHAKDPELLKDLPVKYATFPSFVRNDIPYFIGQDDDLYINTWIGRDSRYVLPGIGCVLSNYKKMFNMAFLNLDIPLLNKPLWEYIPAINYSVFKTENILEWLNKHKNILVLVSNGDVWSNQSPNFDLTTIIKNISKLEKDKIFIITENIKEKPENVVFSGDIIKKKGQDLNEISFLSLFCDTIIGRSSGPFVFCQVKENLYNPNKKFLTFSYHKNSASLIDESIKIDAKRHWSGDFSEISVTSKILEVINE